MISYRGHLPRKIVDAAVFGQQHVPGTVFDRHAEIDLCRARPVIFQISPYYLTGGRVYHEIQIYRFILFIFSRAFPFVAEFKKIVYICVQALEQSGYVVSAHPCAFGYLLKPCLSIRRIARTAF